MCREVVLPGHALDAEAAVLLRRQLTLLRNSQRRDGECPLNSAHINALNARRRRVQTQRHSERGERRVSTLTVGILFGLTANQPLLCVAFGQPNDTCPVSSLRHTHLNATLPACREELKDLGIFHLGSSRN